MHDQNAHWVQRQRTEHTKGTLEADRERRLKELHGGTWDARADRWEEGFRRLLEYVEHNDLQNEFVGAVIGAMASSEDLSTQILNSPELKQKLLGELVPIIYSGLKTTA